MTAFDLFRRRLAPAALAGLLAAPAFAQPPTFPVPPAAGIPSAAVGLPPLVIPPPAAAVVPPVEPMPPAVVPKVTEQAKPIPSEPFRPTPPPPPVTDAPRLTGPATTVRPATFQPDVAAVAEVKPGAKGIDAAAAYPAAVTAAKVALGSVKDYSCHLIFRERVGGKLKAEQTAEFHARTGSPAVAVKVISPAPLAGRELIGDPSRYVGKVRVKAVEADKFVTVSLTDSRLTAENRRGPADLGLAAVLDVLDKQMTIEKRLRNPLNVAASEYEYAGRKVMRFEVRTDRPHALRYAVRTVVFFDAETKLPVRMEAYDGPAGQNLMESYSFVNLRLNPGVPDAVFDR